MKRDRRYCHCGHLLSLHRVPCRTRLGMLWEDFTTWALQALLLLLALLALASFFWPYGSFADPW